MRSGTMWLAWLLTATLAGEPTLVHSQEVLPGTPFPAEPDSEPGILKPAASQEPSPDLIPAPPPASVLVPPFNSEPSAPLDLRVLPEATQPAEPAYVVRAQESVPSDPVLPLPLGHDRMESGGFYVATEYVMFRQSVPLRNEPIAYRGFVDIDGSITGVPGTFIGSRQIALNTQEATGPSTYAPGTKVTTGWKFETGEALEVSWMMLTKVTYSAEATQSPFFTQVGPNLENTFMFSPVFNFPSAFGGPARKINPAFGDSFATYGIWNAASQNQEFFWQRTNQIEATWREPLYENECYRLYGLVGPRFFWIWENFRWRSTDIEVFDPQTGTGVTGSTDPSMDVAVYNNIVSNRMYGAHIGIGNEYWLGNGFSVSLDLQAALFLDHVTEIATYELGLKFFGPVAKRHQVEYTAVPELEANFNIWWYPCEAIQCRLGYNFMAFFDTVAAPQPVVFDFGTMDAPWQKWITRTFDGLNVGVSFIF